MPSRVSGLVLCVSLFASPVPADAETRPVKSIDLKVPPKNKPCHRALRLEVKPPEKRETLLAKFVEPVRRYRVSPVKRGVGLAAGGTF